MVLYFNNVAGPSCDTGWQRYGTACYFVSAEEISFYDAKDVCQGAGAQLTSIHDDDEYSFIMDM